MPGVGDLLKEGTRHLSGLEEAVLRNIEACKKLAIIVKTCLGPNGQNKMVINHLEKLFVTSDAATIIKEMEVVHPAAKMLVLASSMQEQEIGDGTNLVIMFAGELLQQADSLIRMGLHISEIINGYTKAGKKALEILEQLVVFTLDDIRNEEKLSAALKSVVAAKQYGYEDLLAPLIAKAAIQVMPKNPANFNVDNIRVTKIAGAGVLDTSVIKGMVIPRDTEGTIKHVSNAKIVIFAGPIDISATETKGVFRFTNAEQLLNFSKEEEKTIDEIVKGISNSGAKVVIAGGTISEMCLHFLERYKLMVVKVQSKFELRRLCRATGATALVKLGAPTAEELGKCDYVSVEEIGSTKVTIFRQEHEDSAIATLVIRAATPNLLDDLERAVDDAVSVVKAITRDAKFVPGAGATEIELAKQLTTFGETSSALDQYAIKKYGESLEVVPRTLAENAGKDATHLISSLYAAHQEGKKNIGVEIEDGELEDTVEKGIFDLLETKRSAIKLATDVAVTVLRVDQIIMAKPAGGPKPPKQSAGMDTED